MLRMAIIEDGLVINTARWDGVSPWNPGDTYVLLDVTDKPTVCKGWRYDGENF